MLAYGSTVGSATYTTSCRFSGLCQSRKEPPRKLTCNRSNSNRRVSCCLEVETCWTSSCGTSTTQYINSPISVYYTTAPCFRNACRPGERVTRQCMQHDSKSVDRRSTLLSLVALSAASAVGAPHAAWALLDPKEFTDEQWRSMLTRKQYSVLRKASTELPFSSPLNKVIDDLS